MIDLEVIYTILAAVARRRTQLFYEDLSDRYCVLTKKWHDPLASWREPLGELNRLLHGVGWPPLSAVVVLKATNEPGRGFWESSPNTAAQSAKGLARTVMYGQLLDQVYGAHWPKAIPLAPPLQGKSADELGQTVNRDRSSARQRDNHTK